MTNFEVVKENEKNSFYYGDIVLPKRKTSFSAGYDFVSPYDIDVKGRNSDEPFKVTLIRTGIKACMPKDMYLVIVIRSSMAIKHQIMLANSFAVIDSDYYNNPDNDGEIMIPLINLGENNYIIKSGDRIAQGIFHKYHITDNDTFASEIITRTGGIGSTGKN